jgi:hypothetical protein
MKLDHELVREILLAIEECDNDPVEWISPFLPEKNEMLVTYHVMVLNEAGFIDAIDLSTLAGTCWLPKRLTYQGHELIDTLRDKEVWAQTKKAAKKGGVHALGMFWEIGKAVAKAEFSKRTGVAL